MFNYTKKKKFATLFASAALAGAFLAAGSPTVKASEKNNKENVSIDNSVDSLEKLIAEKKEKIAKLIDQINHHDELIKNAKEDLKKLQDKLANAKDELADAQEDKNKATEELEVLEKSEKDAQTLLDAKKHDKETIEIELDVIISKEKKANENLTSSKQMLKEAKDKVEGKKEAVDKAKEKLAELEKKKPTDEEYENFLRLLEMSESLYSGVDAAEEKNEAEIAKRKKNLEKYVQEKTTLNNEIAVLEKILQDKFSDDQAAELKDKKQQLTALEEQIKRTVKEKANFEFFRGNFPLDRKNYLRLINKNKAAIAKWEENHKAELDEFKGKKAELEQGIKDTEQANSDLLAQIDKLTSEIAENEQVFAQFDIQINSNEQQVKQKKSDYEAANNNLLKVQASKQSQLDKISALEEKIQTHNQEIAVHNQSLDEQLNRIKAWQAAQNYWNKEIDTNKALIEQYEELIKQKDQGKEGTPTSNGGAQTEDGTQTDIKIPNKTEQKDASTQTDWQKEKQKTAEKPNSLAHILIRLLVKSEADQTTAAVKNTQKPTQKKKKTSVSQIKTKKGKIYALIGSKWQSVRLKKLLKLIDQHEIKLDKATAIHVKNKKTNLYTKEGKKTKKQLAAKQKITVKGIKKINKQLFVHVKNAWVPAKNVVFK
ncbi:MULTISPECIES: hypothetical protein [Lactobacillus]|uniref:hypothetical protein n=1 Tax=Lactobacillus TaxID=1578 RepID=UPI00248F60DC|nr:MULTISPECIES: hypothetical protein [Lactobacillus]